MAKIYGQLERAQLEQIVGNPAGALTGRIYADVTTPAAAIPYFYNGTAWVQLATLTVGGAFAGGNATGTVNVNWANGLTQKFTLTGNSIFTFSNPVEGQEHKLLIAQDPSTQFYVRFPSDVDWGSGRSVLQYIETGDTAIFSFKRFTAIKAASASPAAPVGVQSIPAGAAQHCSAHPNLRSVAVGHATSPFVASYQYNRRVVGSKLTAPVSLPAGQVNWTAYGNKGNAFLMAMTTTPFVQGYGWFDNDFGSSVANPGTLPAGTSAASVAFSPRDDMVAVASNGSPFLQVYPWSDAAGFGAKLGNPVTLPAGIANVCAFSPDNLFVGVGHATTPFMSVYPITSAAFGTKVADAGSLPPAAVLCMAWSPSGKYLAVGTGTTPFLVIYNWNGTFGATLSLPITPAGQINNITWSPNEDFIAIACASAPFLYIFPFAAGVVSAAVTLGGNPAAAPTGIQWMPDAETIIYSSVTSGFFFEVLNAPRVARNYVGSRL